MQPHIQPSEAYEVSTQEWICALNEAIQGTDQTPHSGLRTNVAAELVNNQPSLFLPTEMAELQPDVLNYLHALGAANNITLVEEQREADVQPLIERREQRPPDLVLGVSLLLQQTGLPGPAHGTSEPHRLKPDNPKVDLTRLIKMAAAVYGESKKVVFLPNRFLTGNFTDQASPMTGYACKVVVGEEKTIVTYFNAPEFHAVGYIANDQFVLHILHAGGSIENPMVWSPYSIMTDAPIRCQVYRSEDEGQDCGILYSTFYIDLDRSMEDEAWWKGSRTAYVQEID